MTRRSWSITVITFAVLILASYAHEIISRVPAYGWLHSHRPFYVAASIDKIGGVAVCLLAVSLMLAMAYEASAASLGFLRPFYPQSHSH